MRYGLLVSVCFVGLLGGCGFELRGTNAPLAGVFEKTCFSNAGMKNAGFGQRVERLLVLNGGKLVSKDAANIEVKLSDISVSSRKIAQSGDASLKEYERVYETTVAVTDLRTQVQLGNKTLSVMRNVQLADNHVLAGAEQAKKTEDSAKNALAQRVIRYLGSFK